MKISTKGRYALRMMVEFALHKGSPCKINQVSRSQHISEKYLEQIVSKLHKANYVKSIRGASGGYILCKDPKDYSVGEILRATEGSLAPSSCLDKDADKCYRDNVCVTQRLFRKIEEAVNQVVDNISLEDLVNDELDIRNRQKAEVQ